jgi:Ran GTPase-activating protein (RanGAP) involved in mRNA processing and transport
MLSAINPKHKTIIISFLAVDDLIILSMVNKSFFNNLELRALNDVLKAIINNLTETSINSITSLLSNDLKLMKSLIKNSVNISNPQIQQAIISITGLLCGRLMDKLYLDNENEVEDNKFKRLINILYNSITKGKIKLKNDPQNDSKMADLVKYLISVEKGNFNCDNSGVTINSLNAIIQSIPLFNRLKKLSLSGNSLGESKLSINNQVITSTFTNLGKLLDISTCLKVVNLSNNKLNEKHLKYFITYLSFQPNLTLLDLSYNLIGGEYLDCFTKLFKKSISLESFDIQNNILGPQGLKYFADGLKDNKTLKKLNISYNGVCANGIQWLGPILKDVKFISLHLSGNYLLDEGAELLGKYIGENKSLSYLFLENNQITAKSMASLSKGIFNCPSLVGVHLNNNKLLDSGAITLYSTLRESKLFSIDVGYNGIGHLSMPSLKEFSLNSSNLGKLDLSGNALGIKSAAYLAEVISICECLRNLSLKGALLGSSLEKLVESIQNAICLKILDLSENNLIDGIKSICSIFLKNRSLSKVDLSENHLDDNSLISIAESLKNNTNLHYINMQMNKITNKGISKYDEILKKNRFKKIIDLQNNFQFLNDNHKDKQRGLLAFVKVNHKKSSSLIMK